MTKDQYLHSLLNDERLVINYTEAAYTLSGDKEVDGTFDTVAHMADQLAPLCETPQHYARARMIVSNLGLVALEHAITENGDPDLLDAELPLVDATDISIAVY